MRKAFLTGHLLSYTVLAVLLLVSFCLSACRDDDDVVIPTVTATGMPLSSGYVGLYVLCEGNMGANKATLDYLDFTTGAYHKNIFPSRNPSQVLELGDVGNDAKIYGSRLWLVINCSNKVEVCDARTARSLGHVDIPNCRFLAFHEGHAYVSSYVGGGLSDYDRRGSVYKVDTATLRVVARVDVGYQPDEIAVSDGKLFVANSGGYRGATGHGYDTTVSVIDLQSFRVTQTIDVAPNLYRLRCDRYGQLWVTSRGIEGDNSQPSRLFVISDGVVTDRIDLPVSDMAFRGDSLCYLATTTGGHYETGVIDLRTHAIVSRQLLKPSSAYEIETPYGLAVHPETGHLFLMDATNYVSSGSLLCFDKDGRFLWRVSTGDIPGHAAFLPENIGFIAADTASQPAHDSRYILAVDEYVPAPGQFVNELPKADATDTPQSMARKCTEMLANGAGDLVTLGSWGGYVTFHFDHPIVNVTGERDFAVWGNAYTNNSEPGIVMVSQDTNGNGKPDDPWYELSGSADEDSIGKVVYDYQLTYRKAPMQDIPWTDGNGKTGAVLRNTFHQQEYYPLWLGDELTFRGTLLPPNAQDQGKDGTSYWVLAALRQGYADNLANSNLTGCSFDIGWAVDANRQPVSLSHVDFIRVYCAQLQQCGWLGETSTEITGAEDLHF
jgi:DNA-binding beta-propeller fold protein YncE